MVTCPFAKAFTDPAFSYAVDSVYAALPSPLTGTFVPLTEIDPFAVPVLISEPCTALSAFAP